MKNEGIKKTRARRAGIVFTFFILNHSFVLLMAFIQMFS